LLCAALLQVVFTTNHNYFFLGGCGVGFGVGFGGLFFAGPPGLPGFVLGLGCSIIGFLLIVLFFSFSYSCGFSVTPRFCDGFWSPLLF